MRENILDAHPSARVRVYTIWLPMLAGDDRAAIDQGLVADRRVRQFWDEERVAGRWFAEANLGGLGYAGIVWDAYFLFSPEAVWNERPTGLVASGTTVLGESDRLAAELVPFLGAESGSAG